MTKNDIITYVILFIIGSTGYFFHTYWSGVISGACFGIMLLALIGKKLYNDAAGRINRRTKDIITRSEFDEEND